MGMHDALDRVQNRRNASRRAGPPRSRDREAPGSKSRSPASTSPARCPRLGDDLAVQLRDLDQVSAVVVRLGDRRACHLGWRHLEFGARRLHPLVVALGVVREEHGCGLALLKERLLVGLGRRVVVARQLQLGAIRLFSRRHGEPAILALRKVRLLYEAGHLRVEAQGLVLVVHVYGCQPDLHVVLPLLTSRLEPRLYPDSCIWPTCCACARRSRRRWLRLGGDAPSIRPGGYRATLWLHK